MNTQSLLLTASLMVGSLSLAHGAAKDAAIAAAKKLAAQENYSWTTTTVVPEGTRWRPGPAHGKTSKNGPTVVEMSYGDNTTEMALQGKKGAMTNRDGDWESLEELESSEGGGRFRANILRNYMTPADEVLQLIEETKELKEADGVLAGDLTEEGAKARMLFRRRGGDGPEILGAKGSVKIWLKDGALVKYQYQVKGTMEWNGNDVDIDRTMTVEIKDVGTTKVEVPEGAKKKLSLALIPVPRGVAGLTVVQ